MAKHSHWNEFARVTLDAMFRVDWGNPPILRCGDADCGMDWWMQCVTLEGAGGMYEANKADKSCQSILCSSHDQCGENETCMNPDAWEAE